MKHPARIATLAALGLLLLWGGLAAQPTWAHEPHPGLNFSIGVRGVNGCNTRASDVTCTLPTGSDFVIEVSLDSLPDDIDTYQGFDISMRYAGVTPKQDGSDDEWPDCGFPAIYYDEPGAIGMGCAMGVPPAGPSSYIGPVGTNTFTCTQNGTIALVHGAPEGFTDLVQDATGAVVVSHAEGAGTSETLTITCGQLPANTPGAVTVGTPGGPGPTPGSVHTPVGGTPTVPGENGPTLEPTAAAKATATAVVKATATAKAGGTTSGKSNGGGGVDTWVWIVIVVGVAAAVLAAAGGGWWYVRSRGGGGA